MGALGKGTPNMDPQIVGLPYSKDPNKVPLMSETPPMNLTKPQTPNPKPQTPNPKPQTPNPKPQTPNPKPQTPNPKP